MAAMDRLVHTVLARKFSCGLKYFWPGFVGLGCNFPVFSHNFVWVSVFLFFFWFSWFQLRVGGFGHNWYQLAHAKDHPGLSSNGGINHISRYKIKILCRILK